MAAKSKVREKVRLMSTESSYYYTTTKNKRTKPEKLELMKFDPKLRKHVLFKEGKLPK